MRGRECIFRPRFCFLVFWFGKRAGCGRLCGDQ